MLAVPPELARRYEARLAQQNILAGQRPHYHKWLRYYLDFCGKYSFPPTDRQSLPAFQENCGPSISQNLCVNRPGTPWPCMGDSFPSRCQATFPGGCRDSTGHHRDSTDFSGRSGAGAFPPIANGETPD